MEEIWKEVVGYEQLYEVSTFGRVRSWINNSGHRRNEPKMLKLVHDNYGYLCVGLSKHGNRKLRKVHRIVAEAFLANPNNAPCINHKDEDKTNNRVENLEWCTVKYNNGYGIRLESLKGKMRNHKDMSKPVLQFSIDGRLIKKWPSLMEIHRQTGYNFGNISSCCLKRKGHQTCEGYVWCFTN